MFKIVQFKAIVKMIEKYYHILPHNTNFNDLENYLEGQHNDMYKSAINTRYICLIENRYNKSVCINLDKELQIVLSLCFTINDKIR